MCHLLIFQWIKSNRTGILICDCMIYYSVRNNFYQEQKKKSKLISSFLAKYEMANSSIWKCEFVFAVWNSIWIVNTLMNSVRYWYPNIFFSDLHIDFFDISSYAIVKKSIHKQKLAENFTVFKHTLLISCILYFCMRKQKLAHWT